MKTDFLFNRPAEGAISSCKPECGVAPAQGAGYVSGIMVDYSGGWVKIHRKIMNNWIAQNDKYLSAWLKMLLEVNHSPKKVLINGEFILCDRGESLNSLETWTRIFGKGWNKSKTRRFFNLLKKDQNIDTIVTQKTTHLKVCNYSKYQDVRHDVETQSDTIVKRSWHDVDTKQERKEGKNEKNSIKKRCFVEPSFSQWEEYCKGNGYASIAEKSFKYYSEANWCDSTGKKLVSWKQKLIAVWFKEENKDKPKSDTWKLR